MARRVGSASAAKVMSSRSTIGFNIYAMPAIVNQSVE
jgi:hypothetical protein